MADDKQRQIELVKQAIIDQNICSELAATANNLVIGDGNLNAEIVLIGEAPGKDEDEQGLPFVGASGKFLNKMLAEAGMSRDDVYITNIVKYRPPNNRDPKLAEKQAFLPFLLRQLEIIQPEVIITLGRHSMEYFLPDAKISDIHGQPQHVEKDGQLMTVIPLYHPAAALFNGSLRQTLIDDFVRVPGIIQQMKN